MDRAEDTGCVVTIDLFHPKLYKISRELALWAHFILTGENPGKNKYMNSITKQLKKLNNTEKEAIYMTITNKQEFVEELLQTGEARGEARGRAIGEAAGRAIGEAEGRAIGEATGILKTLQDMLDLGIDRDVLLQKYPEDLIIQAEQM